MINSSAAADALLVLKRALPVDSTQYRPCSSVSWPKSSCRTCRHGRQCLLMTHRVLLSAQKQYCCRPHLHCQMYACHVAAQPQWGFRRHRYILMHTNMQYKRKVELLASAQACCRVQTETCCLRDTQAAFTHKMWLLHGASRSLRDRAMQRWLKSVPDWQLKA